jgi:pyruvate/2-oxoglutarate dehydrogenase complex dihydrolipoamide acyltransferase (E2) component
MRRISHAGARIGSGGRIHYEVAAVVAVLGLAVLGRPLVAGGQDAGQSFTVGSVPAPAVAAAPPAEAAPALAPAPPDPADPMAWFVPGGRNQGTENLAMALANLALEANAPLYQSDSWGRTTGSTTSDHYVGNTDAWAVDLAVRGIQQPTPQTEEAARRVAAALGTPDWAGGDLRVTIDGYRFQVLWKVSGHFNHVHVGVKRVAAGA